MYVLLFYNDVPKNEPKPHTRRTEPDDIYVIVVIQCHWSKLEGNGTVNWVDAQLTDLGLEQARQAGHFWAKEMAEQKIPMPQSYYSSPLDRCLATARATFSTLDLPPDRPFRPIVKEVCVLFCFALSSDPTHSFPSKFLYIHNHPPPPPTFLSSTDN